MTFQEYEKLVDSKWVEAVFEELVPGDIFRKAKDVEFEFTVLDKPFPLEGENWGVKVEGYCVCE